MNIPEDTFLSTDVLHCSVVALCNIEYRRRKLWREGTFQNLTAIKPQIDVGTKFDTLNFNTLSSIFRYQPKFLMIAAIWLVHPI
jgi:hypothetical protein